MNNEGKSARRSSGVIGSLTAGFEMLAQNLHAAALPVVLDLVLWLGPHVSVLPLVERATRTLAGQATRDPEVTAQVEVAVVLLEEFGQRFNLLSVMGGVPLFQVPSLLARRAPAAGSPLGMPHVVSVSSVLGLFPFWAGLGIMGLGLGFLYLNEIASQVKGGVGPGAPALGSLEERETEAGENDLRKGVWKLLRFLAFAGGLIAIGLLVVPVWILMVTLGATIAEPLGVLLWIGGVGTLSYAALHLLFVIPGLLVGGRRLLRAIGESILLSHVSLSSVFGFVFLTMVIYEGLSYAWSLPNSDSWALLIGIVGNAFVATGLTGAAFVFYRDRLIEGHRVMGGDE